jgi:hypothetical protein
VHIRTTVQPFPVQVHTELQLRVKSVDSDSGEFFASPASKDFCCDDFAFNGLARSVASAGERGLHRWRPAAATVAAAAGDHKEAQKPLQEEEEAAAAAKEEAAAPPSQCERNPLCVRGYKHGGKGGRCSVAAEEEAAEEEDEEEEEGSDAITPAEALQQAAADGLQIERSDRAASGFKGVYPSGGRFMAHAGHRRNLNLRHPLHPPLRPSHRHIRLLLPSQVRSTLALLRVQRKRHSRMHEPGRAPPPPTTTTIASTGRRRRSWVRRQQSPLRPPKASSSRSATLLPATRASTSRAPATRPSRRSEVPTHPNNPQAMNSHYLTCGFCSRCDTICRHLLIGGDGGTGCRASEGGGRSNGCGDFGGWRRAGGFLAR